MYKLQTRWQYGFCHSGSSHGSDRVTKDVALLPLDGQSIPQSQKSELGFEHKNKHQWLNIYSNSIYASLLLDANLVLTFPKEVLIVIMYIRLSIVFKSHAELIKRILFVPAL